MSNYGFHPAEPHEGPPHELPVRDPGAALAAAKDREAEEIIAARDASIAAAVRNETPKGGVY
jgi:hypothetical protein